MYEFEGFRLDPERRRLISVQSGEPLHLSPKVLETLLYLAERRGEFVEKAALMQAIWPRVVVEDNSLDRNISTLRRALGEKAGENRFVATVPGKGYRFVAAVRIVPSEQEREAARPAGAADRSEVALLPTNDVSAPQSRTRFGAARTPWIALALGGALTAIVLGGIYGYGRGSSEPTSSGLPFSTIANTSTEVPRASVAVMPFANLTGDPALQYLSDGIADELIYSLARVQGLKVPARTSSFAYRGRDVDIRQIARDLGVATVIEGSVRSLGDELRVTVQLVDAQTGFGVWSESYDRAANDTLALQAELASQVVVSLSPSLHSGTVAAGSRPPTSSSEAYRLFLEANAVGGASERNLRKALELLDRAIELDPKFARALAARAATRLILVYRGTDPPANAAYAERDATLAVSLDPYTADAHAALGTLYTLRGRWLDAEAAYQAALSIASNDPLILGNHQMLLASAGKLQAAIGQAEIAYGLAPLALPAIMRRAMAFAILERDEPAMRDMTLGLSFGAAQDGGGVPFIRAGAAHRAGRHAEAAASLMAYMPPEARAADATAALRLAYEAADDPAKRPAAIAALHQLSSQVPFASLAQSSGPLLIILHTMVGDLDGAYAVANRAIDEHLREGFIGTSWFGIWLPSMLPFRQDPRFPTFARRLGLLAYWETYGAPDGCVLERGEIACR